MRGAFLVVAAMAVIDQAEGMTAAHERYLREVRNVDTERMMDANAHHGVLAAKMTKSANRRATAKREKYAASKRL